MLQSIQQAQHYILIEMYLVNSGQVSQRFFQAMAEARARGVQVYFLMDAFGSRKLEARDIRFLNQHKIHISFYNPIELQKHQLALFRDHRKLLVVDGHMAYVGGAGFIDEFDPSSHTSKTWRENMVKIEGPNVVQWQALFADNWRIWSDTPLPVLNEKPDQFDQLGRVTMTQGPRFLEIKRSFIKHVRHARTRIWMSTAYFAPSRKLRRELRRAALSGVDVRILIPGPITDLPMARYLAQRYYHRLLRDGVRIFEYQPRFMHAKLVLCDDWVSLGSCNIDRWNLLWNLDANQEIQDTSFASSVVEMFNQDFQQCHEVSGEQWQRRSWLVRIRIWFWSSYIQLGAHLLNRLRILRHWKIIRKQRS
ncbi:MAG: phospholipase D-like domain-containing protein [Gammaproteobacteria bacterium]|nr:phospholipase D-like domain-containing protein [Gammaproteobacteria bacterium]